jgi:hypothetical protein
VREARDELHLLSEPLESPRINQELRARFLDDDQRFPFAIERFPRL